MDNSFFEDSWSPSLRDDLTDFAAFAEPSWNSIMSGFMHNSPLPRTFPPRPHDPHPPPVPVQQPQGHDTHAARSSTYQNLPSDSSNQRRSHLDPPNFPLQPVVGPPSNVNTSGGQLAPLILATSASAPSSQDQLPHRPRHVSPLSEDTFWSSPESSDSSVRSDTPFPQAEDLSDFVDLTQDSSPNTMSPAVGQQRREPKRRHPMSPRTAVSLSSRATSTVPSNPAKRRKTEASQSSMQSAKIEEIDLRDVDDDNGLSKVLEQQRLATIKAQQEQANKPVKLSTLQCIICMENMKDLTATHCGKLHSSVTCGPSSKLISALLSRPSLLPRLPHGSPHSRREPRLGARKRHFEMPRMPQEGPQTLGQTKTR